MGLDARGNIAAAEIALYIPVLLIGVFLALRHGFKREAGWVFLVVLSIGVSPLLRGVLSCRV